MCPECLSACVSPATCELARLHALAVRAHARVSRVRVDTRAGDECAAERQMSGGLMDLLSYRGSCVNI